MIPSDDFTPHGYLDNPYHSWKLNPSGVLRSLAPLGMGWQVPNVGTYVRNQFQYTAHLTLGLKINELVLITPEDFRRQGCLINSPLHTRNRFEYNCVVPTYGLFVRVRYFLVHEHALGCRIGFSTMQQEEAEPLTITCYLIHQHTHNPFTSRLWEHGLYARGLPGGNCAMLGIASEGDVFLHGLVNADTGPTPTFAEPVYATSLEEIGGWARGTEIAEPSITQQQEETGWQVRTLALPADIALTDERQFHALLARGVSLDQTYTHWREGLADLLTAEQAHQADDEHFWSGAPRLTGNWPSHWRRGLVYDYETLRMTLRPPSGIITHEWDGMQLQAPRVVLAEAAMDVLLLSYADPRRAAEIILGHFATARHPNVPCMREDGGYTMVADDGQICGTAPEWGYPLWCCDSLFRRSGDLHWLRQLYPGVAAYLRWWLDHRRDAEGWGIYACSWESGQDVSSRFGPQQTGGTIIQHVRPVDLQASLAQGAAILARWANLLAHMEPSSDEEGPDFSAEATLWGQIAEEFTLKTRQMWQNGWFRDYDSQAAEWSSQQDAMHLAAVFCGAATSEQVQQLQAALAQAPWHSQHWAPLCWPPVVMTLTGAAAAAEMAEEAAAMAYQFIESAYRSIDQRNPDPQDGLAGVTREYHQLRTSGNKQEYVNAGIEGYGWGALSIQLLIRYLLGLREEEPGSVTILPMFPKELRRAGARYRVAPIQWGAYALEVECLIGEQANYTLNLSCQPTDLDSASPASPTRWSWEGRWGERRTVQLSSATRGTAAT